MEKRTKRARGSNWIHAHTMALAELKREASLNKEDGRLVWERIARTLSSRFPGQIRTDAQCRRRWDTLVKVYNHIEDYCVETGAQDHRELDEDELASMKLDTAYHEDWYDIVKQVCSQRKRKERFPERPPDRDTLWPVSTSRSVTHHERSTPESTTTYAQVSSSPSSETDKPSPEEEVPRRQNGYDGLMLEATQLRHGQVSHEVSREPQIRESTNLVPHTFPAENGAQLKEPLQNDWWNLFDAMPIETSAEIEQSERESELTQPSYWDLESFGLGAQPKETLQYYVRDDLFVTANASSARERNSSGFNALSQPALHSERGKPHPLEYMPIEFPWYDLPEWVPCYAVPPSASQPSAVPPSGIRSYPCMLPSSAAKQSESQPSAVRPKLNASEPSSEYTVPPSAYYAMPPSAYYAVPPSAYEPDILYGGSLQFGYPPRYNLPSTAIKSSPVFVNQDGLNPSAITTSRSSSQSADSTISRQSRRWSLKVIVLNVLQCCHACGRKEWAEDMKMELRGKSSSKCVPIGKLCAKLSRTLFAAFHGQSSEDEEEG